VTSIARQTARRSPRPSAFLETFFGRLQAMAATHDLLAGNNWLDASLREIIVGELAPYIEPESARVTVNGPPTSLNPRIALTLALAIHELTTNAVKHGAFSVPDGRAEVSWTVTDRNSARFLELCWAESDGPAMPAKITRGFGSELIERAVAFELGGETKIRFDKGGLQCIISVPFDAPAAAPGKWRETH
jgi:two-component system, NtrC family, sensor kinase